jgi:hypothetical protein
MNNDSWSKFKHDDKIEQQMEEFHISLNPQHLLALFKAAVKIFGTFDATIKT